MWRLVFLDLDVGYVIETGRVTHMGRQRGFKDPKIVESSWSVEVKANLHLDTRLERRGNEKFNLNL
jgi:hypothetical protein